MNHEIFDFQRIQDKIIFSTVRIERSSDHKVGTGFLISHRISETTEVPFLVTNKHIKHSCENYIIAFNERIEEKPVLGQKITINMQIKHNEWFEHPEPRVDICILPFANIIKQVESQGKQIFHLRLPKDIIPTPEKYHLIKPIEEIIFIGYPAGRIDTKYLLPIVRRGLTSTPILAEFMGYKVFLIDAFIYGGSSGSPVFILDDSGTYSDGKGRTIAGGRFFLVGILSKRLVVTENYEIVEIESVHGIKHERLLNLGTIFHSQLIKDTIDLFLKENKIG